MTTRKCPFCENNSLHKDVSPEDGWVVEYCIGELEFTYESEEFKQSCPYWDTYANKENIEI